MSQYLKRRSPLIKKMSIEKRIEICRAATLVSIWGVSTLFQQGEVGDLFYIILSGEVKVFVTVDNYVTDKYGISRVSKKIELVNVLVEGKNNIYMYIFNKGIFLRRVVVFFIHSNI